MSEMEANFSNKFKSKDVEMINIVLGQFYDGCQVYKSKFKHFAPLLLTIFNVPPSYRLKLATGMFMLGTNMAAKNGKTEWFLLRHLLGQELTKLNDGILIEKLLSARFSSKLVL
jgi:hypothetical protein